MRRIGSTWPVEPFKVVATLLVNVPLGIWKDVRFAQIFGGTTRTGATSRSPLGAARTPSRAMAAFLLRDSLTIFGGFCLPSLLARAFADQHHSLSISSQIILAQLIAPPLLQIVATPIHLRAVGLCAGTGKKPPPLTARSVLPATMARCLRVIPAYGVGCLANAELRRSFGSSTAM